MRTTCVLAALVVGAGSEAADITYETRALTGTDGPLGPGLGVRVTFSSLSHPVLDAAGQTAFLGGLRGTGVTIGNDSGVWSEGGGSGLALIARRGNQAPGTAAGVSFIPNFSIPVLNGEGQAAFRGFVTGPGVTSANDGGIWSEGGGSGVALIAREGNQAPGTAAGVNFSDLNGPVLNNAGQTAFSGFLTGPSVTSANDGGIWSEGGGSGVALIAREGDQAPGTFAGVNFDFLFNPVLNSAGQTAFNGQLTGTGVTSANDGGIWSEGGGTGLVLVAREGNQAPGTAAGVYFSDLSGPVLNGAGQTAFRGFLTGTGVTSANNGGVWSEGGGKGMALIAREGNQAPGTATGVNFSFLNVPVLNGIGQTAFRGSLTGPGVTSSNDEGLWSEGGGSGVALIGREGNQPPGTAAGLKFDSFSDPVLNGAGQTAFTGRLTGAGVTSSNDNGIWATSPDGELHLIAREGDRFDVNDDPLIVDRRMILFVGMITASGGEDGRHISFNEAGQLAFWLRFTDDREGIFVATVAAPLTVTIVRAIAPATGYDFAWNSRPGKVYDLVTSTDLVTPINQWPVHATHSNIPATSTTTTLKAVPLDGPQRFFAVIEKSAPLAN